MIIARKGTVVILGLEALNFELLKKGKPIQIELKKLGLPDITLGIMYGDTHDDILAEIERHTGMIPPTIESITGIQ